MKLNWKNYKNFTPTPRSCCWFRRLDCWGYGKWYVACASIVGGDCRWMNSMKSECAMIWFSLPRGAPYSEKSKHFPDSLLFSHTCVQRFWKILLLVKLLCARLCRHPKIHPIIILSKLFAQLSNNNASCPTGLLQPPPPPHPISAVSSTRLDLKRRCRGACCYSKPSRHSQ